MKIEDRGERLKIAMEKRHINKTIVLAAKLGVDESALSRWRKGKPISTENAIKLCDALDISLDWFLTGRGHMDQHRRLVVNQEEYQLMTKIRKRGDSVYKAITVLLSCKRLDC